MEQNTKIRLYEKRDFSQNFEVTLAFVKQNYGLLLKGICFFLPFPIIAAFLTPGQADMQALAQSMDSPSDFFDLYSSVLLGAFIAGIGSFLTLLYTLSYMAEYSNSEDGKVDTSLIWGRLKNSILPVFVSGILYTMLVVVGLIFCILPGIALAFFLGFYVYVYINEDETITGCLKKSFNLVKDNLLEAFIFTLVFGLGYVVLSWVISLLSTLTSLIALGVDSELVSSILNISGNTFVNVTIMLLAPVFYMGMGMLYYSMRNDRHGEGVVNDINQIGQWPVNNNNL